MPSDEPVGHDIRQTVHLRWHYPAHEPRADDPQRHVFEATRRRLKAEGHWRCAVHGCARTDIELHHSKVEWALQTGVDLDAFNEEYGLHLDAGAFASYIASPGNLEAVCAWHHRGSEGVHVLPEPAWLALRVWRSDLPPPAEIEEHAP